MPLLTVVLPVHNCAKYVSAALDSILNQTFRDFELLVVDDGSEDNSVDVVKEHRDPRIRLVPRPHSGLGATLDYAISQCNNPLIARMDADDWCGRDRLERQVAYLERNSHIGAVGTQFTYFGGDEVAVPSPSLPLGHDEIVRELLKGNLALCHASLVVRREHLVRAGGYRIRGVGEDWDMFLRLAEKTRVANLAESLYCWRLHRGNISFGKMFNELLGKQYAKECAAIRARGLQEPEFSDFTRRRRARPIATASDALNALALVHYRKALGEYGDGKVALGASRMAFASLLAPGRAARRISQLASRALATLGAPNTPSSFG
jgi:glycosyltransferase involved in cell wall biosynthesis